MKKERFDNYLVRNGFFETKEKAEKAIMAGLVSVNGQVKTKAGDQVGSDTPAGVISIRDDALPYVSRGGLKLEKGLLRFDFPVEQGVFLDIGSSTGGFTDCLLKNGARRVYAVDVGYGQLDWRLRSDSRVVSMERTNFRHLTEESIPEPVDGTVMDVSFISIVKLLDTIRLLSKEGALGIWLIKPQFEAKREDIGKNGVVRDKGVHRQVLLETVAAIRKKGFSVEDLDFSPIQGPKGNIEFLCFAKKEKIGDVGTSSFDDGAVERLVEKAHAAHTKKDGEDSE